MCVLYLQHIRHNCQTRTLMMYVMFLSCEVRDAEFALFSQMSDIVPPELHTITQL